MMRSRHWSAGGRREERGLTLIETLCAATVLAVAVLGLSQVSLTSNALEQSGRAKSAALRAIEEQVAAIEATPFANVRATFDGHGFGVALEGAVNDALVPPAGDADGLAGLVRVSAPTNVPSELLEVTVRVDWVGRSGAQAASRTLRLSRVGTGS